MNKIINFKIFIFLILISNIVNAGIEPPFKNMIVNEYPIKYENIIFKDYYEKNLNLKDLNSQIYILNFWATWCLPCKEEMPHLDKLQNINGINIFPINIEKNNKLNTQKFFKNLEIKNLSIYFDIENNLVNLFKLRGLPTTIILNNDREEIARVIGFADFSDQKFRNWLNSL